MATYANTGPMTQIREKERQPPVSFSGDLTVVFLMVVLVRKHIMNGIYCPQPPGTQRITQNFLTTLHCLTEVAFSLATPPASFPWTLYSLCSSHSEPITLPCSDQSCAFTCTCSFISKIAFFSSFSPFSVKLLNDFSLQDLTHMSPLL